MSLRPHGRRHRGRGVAPRPANFLALRAHPRNRRGTGFRAFLAFTASSSTVAVAACSSSAVIAVETAAFMDRSSAS